MNAAGQKDEFTELSELHLHDSLAYSIGAQALRLEPGGMPALGQAVAGSSAAAVAMSRAGRPPGRTRDVPGRFCKGVEERLRPY